MYLPNIPDFLIFPSFPSFPIIPYPTSYSYFTDISFFLDFRFSIFVYITYFDKISQREMLEQFPPIFMRDNSASDWPSSPRKDGWNYCIDCLANQRPSCPPWKSAGNALASLFSIFFIIPPLFFYHIWCLLYFVFQ